MDVAATARFDAHPRTALICSAWVTDKGTVLAMARCRSFSFSLRLSENASKHALITASAISAPENPSLFSASAFKRTRINVKISGRFRSPSQTLLQLNFPDVSSLFFSWEIHEEYFVEASLAKELRG